MLGYHKNQFLREHLNLVLLFNGSESLIERKNNRRLLGTSYCLVLRDMELMGHLFRSRDLFFVDSM